MPRTCDVEGCGKPIPTSRFLCPAHWRRVPRQHQRAVYAAFDEWQRAEVGPAKLLAGKALRKAQADALAALAITPGAQVAS